MWILIIIALVLLFLAGGDRLAVLGKGLGQGVKAFRKTVRESQEPTEPEPARRVIVVSAEPKQLSPKDGVAGEPPRTDDSEPKEGP